MHKVRQTMIALLVGAVAVAPAVGTARDDTVTGDKGSDMLVDLVIVRPIGVAATVVGAVAFVVALPFTIPSGSVATSAREMVARPAEYTFSRPPGSFDRCGPDGHPCGSR